MTLGPTCVNPQDYYVQSIQVKLISKELQYVECEEEARASEIRFSLVSAGLMGFSNSAFIFGDTYIN